MKKVVLSTIIFCLSAVVCLSQKSKTPAESNASEQTQIQSIAEISDTEWRILIDAVQAENWEKSQFLAGQYLTKYKVDNEKKQLARLRYIRLYALAGKVVESSLAGKKPEEDTARIELEKSASGFLEKEFFMPSRQISDDCEGRLNYVCRSQQPGNVLRVTATNRTGKAIHSFEYVRLKENFNVADYIGKLGVLGGVLKKIEFNPNKSNVWIMRLFFENGSVNVVPDK